MDTFFAWLPIPTEDVLMGFYFGDEQFACAICINLLFLIKIYFGKSGLSLSNDSISVKLKVKE